MGKRTVLQRPMREASREARERMSAGLAKGRFISSSAASLERAMADLSLDSLAELQAQLQALQAELQQLPQCEVLQLRVEAALWELQDCERRRQQRPVIIGEPLNGIYQARLRALQDYIADLQLQAEGFAAQCHQDSKEPDCPAPALVLAQSESEE